MPFPPHVPGRIYSPSYSFHDDPVYRVEATSSGINHDTEFESGSEFFASHDGNGQFIETIGGPFPDFGATVCIWSKITKGRIINGFWNGTCPDVDDGPSVDFGDSGGSGWDVHTPAPAFGAQIADATCYISGWLLKPWEIHSAYTNQWMDDDDLEAEVIAITVPDGWFLEWEAFHPIFLGWQFAPDEIVDAPVLRTEGVQWRYPVPGEPEGWNFHGVDSSNVGIWTTGDEPKGTLIAYYDGGLADWVDPLPEWPVPVQSDDRFICSFETPEDGDAEAIPLTCVGDSIFEGAPPVENGVGGREDQALVIRAAWRTPRYRFYREGTSVVRQYPRDDNQGWGSGTRLYPPTKANRTVGGIQ